MPLSEPRDRLLNIFAVTPPGVESLTAGELGGLGIKHDFEEPGGVGFSGTLDDVYRANLWLRTANRLMVRVGTFHARGFNEIERHASRLPWEEYVSAGQRLRLRVTCRKSRLYHSDAVAERIADGIRSRLGSEATVDLAEGEEDAPDADGQLVTVRLMRDECTISVDSSGDLLHKRGYRLAVAKAPVRETLAAATLMASGWNSDAPLLDPMCGSGTIPIEAALIARRIAPGLDRRFAYMKWPAFDEAKLERFVDDARSRELQRAPERIQGSDRDAGAVSSARANSERARVADDVELTHTALSGIQPRGQNGFLVTNPPYGERVGEQTGLRNLYAQLGNVARQKCPGWTLALLSADRDLERHVGIPLNTVVRTSNGGIKVRVVRGAISSRDA